MIGNSQKIRESFFILAILCLFVATPSLIFAQTATSTDNIISVVDPNRYYESKIGQSAKSADLTFKAFENAFLISITAVGAESSAGVRLAEINESADLPWQLSKISKIYQYEVSNKPGQARSGRYRLGIRYEKDSAYLKSIFFYDKSAALWKRLPSNDDPAARVVWADASLGFARVAVFENPEILTVGKASWYAHKGGLFAASPDYPKGSKLKVVNRDNGKSVTVEINDFGPDRALHPDRVVDLDKVAFKKIGRSGQGTVRVQIIPLDGKIKATQSFFSANGYSSAIRPVSKSAIILNAKTGEVLFSKNASASVPIASLTKIVAAKVFLDTRPSLDRVVSYSTADEEKNYAYAEKWEVARLRLKNGDSLTVADLLHSALIGSANNAVESLVRVSGLSRDDFIARMNAYALSLGATTANFREPTGLSPENVSSASDYAIMTNEILKHPLLEKISKMKSYEFRTINTKQRHYLKNSNALIIAGNLKITGSKTGYLNEAGYCLMTKAIGPGGAELIVVTLGSPDKAASFNETKNLLYYGFSLMNI